MIKDVLIVDGDEAFCNGLKNTLEEYSDSFSVRTAMAQGEALESLAEVPYSILLLGLDASQEDDLTLVDYVREFYPETPVLAMSDSNSQESKSTLQKKGAEGFVKKPFEPRKLAKKISTILKKETDAGSLQGVSPGMFLQLIEMEERSCVIRLQESKSGTKGLLFFRDGELVDARVRDKDGAEAAYKIFSWDEVSLAIQGGCPPKDKKIHMNAQAVLLEAMRRKDEGGGKGAAVPIFADSSANGPAEPEDLPPDQDLGGPSLGDFESELSDEDLVAGHEDETPEPANIVSAADLLADDDEHEDDEPENLVDSIRLKLDREIGPKCGLEEIVQDESWDAFIEEMDHAGSILGAGKLSIGYVEREEGPDCVVLPGETATLVYLNPRCPKNRILQVLIT